MTPEPKAIRPALDAILASESFAASERHRDLLRFLVEETLAGRGDRLKGFTIAIEVFGKDPDFDAQNDSLVRVEVGRLRKRLAEYYRTAGRDDALRIELKRGNYAPEFTAKEQEPARAAPVPPGPPPRWVRFWPALAGVAALVAAVALFVDIGGPGGGEPSEASMRNPPRIRVQTFANISDPGFDYFANGLTEELLIKLDRYRSTWGQINVFHAEDLSELDISDQHDYLLDGTVSRVEDSIRVTARVVDAVSGAQIWTDSYSEAFEYANLFATQDRIAIEIADAIRDPFGSIADAEVRKTLDHPVDALSPYGCNLLFLHAIDELTPSARDSARQCLERHDGTDSLTATGLGALAFLYHLDYQEGRDFLVDEPPAIDAAYDAAQRALDRDGNDVQAHIAMAVVHLNRQRWDQARSSTERMLSQNPPPSALGIGALLLLKLGNVEEGMSLFARALAESPRTTPSLFIGPTFFHIGRGELGQALAEAERIDAPDFLMAQLLWAALTAQVGEMERARRHAANVLSMHPGFASYGEALIDRWALPPYVAQTLVDGLQLAGIALK